MIIGAIILLIIFALAIVGIGAFLFAIVQAAADCNFNTEDLEDEQDNNNN